MSSAYVFDCKKVVEDRRSFINIEKSVGDRIDPCGTPKITVLKGVTNFGLLGRNQLCYGGDL